MCIGKRKAILCEVRWNMEKKRIIIAIITLIVALSGLEGMSYYMFGREFIKNNTNTRQSFESLMIEDGQKIKVDDLTFTLEKYYLDEQTHQFVGKVAVWSEDGNVSFYRNKIRGEMDETYYIGWKKSDFITGDYGSLMDTEKYYEMLNMHTNTFSDAIYDVQREENKICFYIRYSEFSLKYNTPYLFVRKDGETEFVSDEGDKEYGSYVDKRYYFDLHDNAKNREIIEGSYDVCLSKLAMSIYSNQKVSGTIRFDDVSFVYEDGSELKLCENGNSLEDKILGDPSFYNHSELGNQYDYTNNSYFDSILFAKSFDMTMYGDYKSCRTIVFRNAIDIDGVKEVHVDGKIFHMS